MWEVRVVSSVYFYSCLSLIHGQLVTQKPTLSDHVTVILWDDFVLPTSKKLLSTLPWLKEKAYISAVGSQCPVAILGSSVFLWQLS